MMQGDSNLGRAIQVRRAELGIKRKDLAKLALLSYPYLSELENGSKVPSAKALAQLANALQLSPADLLSLAEAIRPPAPAGREVEPSSADRLSAVPERWARLPTAGASHPGPATSAASTDLPRGVADNAILDRIAERVAVTVRAELNAWARSELPVLVRDELSRLMKQAEGGDL
jgi:transcriptional regulator with XRE-family HTH domain